MPKIAECHPERVHVARGLCSTCYARLPERKAWRREYRRRPDVKARKAKYMRAYYQRPEVKARRAKYMLAYHMKARLAKQGAGSVE